MPAQCKTGVEILPNHTINKPENYPKDGLRDLHSMATMFGYSCAEDLDERNKNFLHHLFQAMKYCSLFGETALRAFKQHRGWTPEKPWPGNMKGAIRHPISHGIGKGLTPLHILCHGSDVMMATADVVKNLLDSKIGGLDEFDKLKGPKAFRFFLSCIGTYLCT